ncbi:hypothetical protein [Microbacterium testaceum]|uniref:hypothetical protein n=1 Tax=Microbacterium testaceum TaxID=2033 RepID=UPI0012AC720C|nr:hypothetical protein [Microbacterium testaceum]
MPRPAGHPTIAEAFSALTDALGTTTPSCAGDDRFTCDDGPVEPLVTICKACPLLGPCRDVALAAYAGPIFGVVGGMVRRTSGKRSDLGRSS